MSKDSNGNSSSLPILSNEWAKRISMMTINNPNTTTTVVPPSSTSTSSYSASTGTEAAQAETMAQQQQQEQEQERKKQEDRLKCPRCDSSNTKFCYYNNYSLSQPRYFCKACKRYWTRGGTLRNVPVGGGCRKNKRTIKNKHSKTSSLVLPPLNLIPSNDNNNNNNNNMSSSIPNSFFYGISSSSSHLNLQGSFPAALIRPVYEDIQLPHEALSGFSNINPAPTFLTTNHHYSSFDSQAAASLLVSSIKQPKKMENNESYHPTMLPFDEGLQVCSTNQDLGLLKDHVKVENGGELCSAMDNNSSFEWSMNQFEPFTDAAADTGDSAYNQLWNSVAWPDAVGSSSLMPLI